MSGNAVSAADIAGPDTTGQAETAVVGDADRILFVLEWNRHHHRAEDFFLRAIQRVGACQDGRVDIVTGLFRDRISMLAHQLRAVFERLLDHVFHVIVLLGVVDRADLGFRVARITDLELRRSHRQSIGELLEDRLLHQQARTGNTALPGTGKDCSLGTAQGDFQVGIVEHNVGRLAAQFQHRRNATLRCRHGDMPASGG